MRTLNSLSQKLQLRLDAVAGCDPRWELDLDLYFIWLAMGHCMHYYLVASRPNRAWLWQEPIRRESCWPTERRIKQIGILLARLEGVGRCSVVVMGFTTDEIKMSCIVLCVLGPHMLDCFKAGYRKKYFFLIKRMIQWHKYQVLQKCTQTRIVRGIDLK